MAYEGFVDYWATRLSRLSYGSPAWAAGGVRCLRAADADFGALPNGMAIRSEVLDRVRYSMHEKYRQRRLHIKAAERAVDYGAMRIVDESSYLKPANLRPGKMNWARGSKRFMDGYDDPGEPIFPHPDSTHCKFEFRQPPRPVGKRPELAMGYCGDTVQYGRSLAVPDNLRKILEANGVHGPSYWVTSKLPEKEWEQEYLCDFNNGEGEKDMDKKIDWHKPLRNTNGRSDTVPAVTTYKSGKQRVIWCDDRVYPVDDFGRAVADVKYPHFRRCVVGEKIVENVPEEKFFLGLGRSPDGTYWLTDGGVPTTMSILRYWEKSPHMAATPRWIVDTRKAAEAPVKHDPKDWAVVYYGDEDDSAACNDRLMTKEQAKARFGGVPVRVRTTPAPADTARYIQLWRLHPSNPWRINAHGSAVGGSQEFTWAETQHRGADEYRTAIKVRD